MITTESPSLSVEHLSLNHDQLAIHWGGVVTAFHYVWLRDNCGCTECRHPVVGERLSDPAAIPLDLVAVSARVENAKIVITWPDGHVSSFSPGWLRKHAYDAESRSVSRRRIETWIAEQIRSSRPEFLWGDIMSSDATLLTWLESLSRFGFTLVKGLGSEPGTVAQLAQRVAFLRDSNFGLVWEVRSEPKPDSLAYTSVKLTAHTDLVSREAQPGVQFLHCLVNDAEGGESILVDGFAGAEELKRIHPQHWDTLTRVPASYRYQNDNVDVSATAPVIRLDHRGEYYEIRYSNALLAPLDCDPVDVVPFYAAYQAFSLLLREPRFEYAFRLEAGDCEVFDNRRVLHGRNEFNPNTGRRHLQGCYVDTDDFLGRINVLRRTEDFRAR
jgi:gamma-butyrobetaine dioxygenase